MFGVSFFPKPARRFVSAAIHSIRLNAVWTETHHGRTSVCKQRNRHGLKIARLSNFYFRLAGIPIRYLLDLRRWRRWEIHCFNLLNGGEFEAVALGPRAFRADQLPGRSLWDCMEAGTLDATMLAAAGQELRRSHGFWSDEFNDLWSHGDLSITNILFDQETGRARLIDFEMRHDHSLSALERQADDLLVVVLDLAGVARDEEWLPFTRAFLQSYGNADVIALMADKLFFPVGLARLWWKIRTNFGKPAKVRARFASLRQAISTMEFQPEVSAFPPNKRRPSISCQTSKPGTPMTSSRTLAMSESAKASSP